MTTHKGSQASKEKIARSALRLFARKGYATASLEEIATQAGFTKGAVYHFFKSKEALLLSLLRDIEERSIGKTTLALEQADGGAMDRLVRFKNLQAQWAARNADDLAILIWVSIESAHRKSAIRTQVLHIYARIEEVLTAIIELGKQSGEFPADLPVADVVTWLISLHDGNMLSWYRSGRDIDVGRRLTRASRQAAQMAIRMGQIA
jgi:AcrR family transcriptional regulator